MTDLWDQQLTGADRVWLSLSTRLEVSTIPVDGGATLLERLRDTGWVWHTSARISLRVNNARVVDGQPAEHGDRFVLAHVSGQGLEGAFRLEPVPHLALNRPLRDEGERSLATWRDTDWSGITTLRRRGGWLVFPGPGGRTRALALTKPLGGCAYVGASLACVRAVDVVDVTRDGTCFVRNVGVASLAELLKTTVVQAARLDPALAVHVVRALDARQAMPGSISVDEDGRLHAHVRELVDLAPRDLCRVLCWLLGARAPEATLVDTLGIDDRDARQQLRRLLTLADSSTPHSYRAELAAFHLRPVRNAELGVIVRALFADRIAKERELDEQIGLLDDDTIAALRSDRAEPRG